LIPPVLNMKTWDLRTMGWVLGVSTCTTLHAEQPMSTVSPKFNASPLRSSLTLLIRADAEKLRSNTQTDAETSSELAGDVVVLQPLIVQSDKLPNFTAPAETGLAKVLRTGSSCNVAAREPRFACGAVETLELYSASDVDMTLAKRAESNPAASEDRLSVLVISCPPLLL
jgi:hypothetical protein